MPQHKNPNLLDPLKRMIICKCAYHLAGSSPLVSKAVNNNSNKNRISIQNMLLIVGGEFEQQYESELDVRAAAQHMKRTLPGHARWWCTRISQPTTSVTKSTVGTWLIIINTTLHMELIIKLHPHIQKIYWNQAVRKNTHRKNTHAILEKIATDY